MIETLRDLALVRLTLRAVNKENPYELGVRVIVNLRLLSVAPFGLTFSCHGTRRCGASRLRLATFCHRFAVGVSLIRNSPSGNSQQTRQRTSKETQIVSDICLKRFQDLDPASCAIHTSGFHLDSR